MEIEIRALDFKRIYSIKDSRLKEIDELLTLISERDALREIITQKSQDSASKDKYKNTIRIWSISPYENN